MALRRRKAVFRAVEPQLLYELSIHPLGFLSPLRGLVLYRTLAPTVETVGYGRVSLGDRRIRPSHSRLGDLGKKQDESYQGRKKTGLPWHPPYLPAEYQLPKMLWKFGVQGIRL